MAPAASAPSREITTKHDALSLIKDQGGVSLYPSDDELVSLLQGRFRLDLPYTRLGSSVLLVVNPLKTLANLNEASASSYAEKDWVSTASGPKPDRSLQPHIYELAVRVFALASRTQEDQAVIFSGLTGAGKTFNSERFVEQVLRLAAKSKAEKRIAERLKSVYNVLDSFGTAKTPTNASASRFGKYLELHLTDAGRLVGGKLLVFGLDKSRVNRLRQDERSYNVFYQLLAGADPDERDALNLDDPSSYTLLASSGCYLLPGGPLSDDHAQMGELRASMANLGFKHRHLASIWQLLTAILLLGNLEFIDNGQYELSYESATVSNPEVLDEVANLLGLGPAELEQALTNKSAFIRNELTSRFLNAGEAARQRDSLVRDIYTLLFAYVVDTINRNLEPEAETVAGGRTMVSVFDQPGYQSRTPSGSLQVTDRVPLVASANGQNAFEEFTYNYAAELTHASYVRRAFSDGHGSNAGPTADRVSLPAVMTMDNAGCVELLRGGPVGSKYDCKIGGLAGFLSRNCLKPSTRGSSDWDKDVQLLEGLTEKFGPHASFVTSPEVGLGPSAMREKTLFGINHYAGSVSYDIHGFVEKNTDVLDPSLVDLLRGSRNAFVSRLSSAGIAVETHPNDNEAVVQAQIPITPLQHPTSVAASPFADGNSAEPESLLIEGRIYPVTTQLNATLADIITSYERSRTWDVLCIRPNDNALPNAFDKRRVKSQVRALLLPDLVIRRQTEYVASFAFADFGYRYGLGQGHGLAAILNFATTRGWAEGADFAMGEERIWLSYTAWREIDDELRSTEADGEVNEQTEERDHGAAFAGLASPNQPWAGDGAGSESQQNLVLQRTDTHGSGYLEPAEGQGFGGDARLISKNGYASSWIEPEQWDDKGAPEHPLRDNRRENDPSDQVAKDLADGLVVNEKRPGVLEEKVEETRARVWWLRYVKLTTWWVPTFALKSCGGMKRADIRLAWREKLAIFLSIFFMCGVVIFYVVVFGRLLCPNFAKAWNTSQLGEHAQENDFFVAVAGKVYDITDFWQGQHSDVAAYPVTDELMLQLAGQDLTGYFPIPFTVSCPGLVTDETLTLQRNFTPIADYAVHWSGEQQNYGSAALADNQWYPNKFLPFMRDFYKGDFVWSKGEIQGQADSGAKTWGVYKDGVYDISDYLQTLTYYEAANSSDSQYSFLDDSITRLFQNQPGKDLTTRMEKALGAMNATYAAQQYTCLRNAFYVGRTDFRDTPRCTVNNYILLAFSVIIMLTIGAKFLAALQLSSKRNPEMLDKFVICQVPCYTEGEESLRTTIDSLAALRYDDKRKLMFIICDGNIYGSGNDKPTPRIVLDILGVDEKVEADPLMFKSVAEGSKQINYGKVYSGLYEFEGHVVPYMVVVKVGSPRERSKPGNRGKRDSQCLLLRYLNRVHFDAPMCPLELEMYHQMRNVIGIDPAFYEYLFQVDADTCVAPESLNRMISCTIDDSAIIGICGETKLQNEMQSWTTMIQVYEYFMSHHLAKAFESLFGSVTCLPGCFSVYRLRTADKGRPIIISQRIIDDYSEPVVDTLHKKNLFSLGEDRYLTTLMMKYFPSYKMKFTPDALAYTVAPDRWSVLLSQRRRWINSTIHNLGELYFLPEMCGFCIFSMRFIVFLDLIGTIILPATCVYLFYLIITVAIGQAPIPIIALAMIGATYGLQVIIFLIKREFMLIGWMVIYILAYPIYSFFLPIYSFWSMDDFSWGNTRVVVGEGKDKIIQMPEDEYFDDSMIPLKKFSDYENEVWEKVSRQDSGSVAGSDYGSQRDSARPRARAAPISGYDSPNGGDYYRDSSPLKHHDSNQNLRSGSGSRVGSPFAPGSQYGGGGSQYGNPALPFGAPMMLPPMGFNAGPHAGSDYSQSLLPPQFPGMGAPRNTMMSLNSFAGSMPGPPSSYGGSGFPLQPGLGGGMGNARMSTFSLATTANLFGATPASESTDPTDDEILAELRHYLSTQDLMTVTKKTSRTAVFARFPKADLSGRVAWLNSCIDQILQGQ